MGPFPSICAVASTDAGRGSRGRGFVCVVTITKGERYQFRSPREVCV